MADEQAPKGGKKKLVMIAAPALVVVGLGAFFLLGRGGGEEVAASTTTTVAQVGEVIEGDTLTVNLADEGDPRYARVTFAVVLPVGADSGLVGMKISLLKDRALDIIAGYSADELLGDGGFDDLRRRLSDAAAEIWPDGEVMEVVLTEVLVQ